MDLWSANSIKDDCSWTQNSSLYNIIYNSTSCVHNKLNSYIHMYNVMYNVMTQKSLAMHSRPMQRCYESYYDNII